MDLFRGYLCGNSLLIVAFLLLVDADKAWQPQLNQRENSNNVIGLECVVSNFQRSLSLHFYCRIEGKRNDGKDRCFENCKQISNFDIKVNCTQHIANSTLTIRYDIEKTTMSSGNYFCQYKGLDSSHLSHKQMAKPTEKVFQLTTVATRKPAPIVTSFVRMELIMGLLGLFALSLLLNIAFAIRCCIVRRYLYKYPHVSRRSKASSQWSWVTCFCLKEEIRATDVYYKIRDRPSSETSKSKSSATNEYLNRPLSQDTEKLCFSSATSQMSRSSTFAAGPPYIIHTPIDQYSLSALPGNTLEGFHPFMVPYAMDPESQAMKTLANPNHRRSSYYIYDEVPGEHIMMNASTMPIRHFASTGSLHNRPRQQTNTNFKGSPLPEEDQNNFSKFSKDPSNPDEEMGLMVNDGSSVLQDFSSSEETYLSNKDDDSVKDQLRVAKLEMSREMMTKAETLLREAHNLLGTT